MRNVWSSSKGFLPMVLFGVVWCWALADLVDHWPESNEGRMWLQGLRYVRGFLAGVAWLAVPGLLERRRRGALTAREVRVALYAILASVGAATLLELIPTLGFSGTIAGSDFEVPQAELRSVFFAGLQLGFLVWGFWVRFQRRLSTSRGLRILDVMAMNGVVLFLFGEFALLLTAVLWPSPLFLGGSVARNVESMREAPGHRFFGFPLNSRGYHDEEFFVAEEEDLVVAVLADSFGFGVVPFEYNYVSIAERLLQEQLGERYRRVALHNFGVPGIGMFEYAHLLQTEVLRTRPHWVVLSVFVGNDIVESRPPKNRRYSFLGWHLVGVPTRLLALLRNAGSENRVSQIGATSNGTASSPIPAYIHDSSQEPPTFTLDRFLAIEAARVEVLNPENRRMQRRFECFFAVLDSLQARLGGRLLVLLLPDEFQVNDELRDLVLSEKDNPQRYQLRFPQARIRDYCRTEGIAVVDVLDPLREAELDGRTYHLRDTHFNSRGNRIVGQELFKALVDRVRADLDN